MDAIREELVTSLEAFVGSEQNLFEETPEHCRQLRLKSPLLTDEELARVRALDLPGLSSVTLSTLFDAKSGSLQEAVDNLCTAASQAIDDGKNIVILSDRGVDANQAPIPSLLATSAVHHHLTRAGTRTRVGLVVESGEPREVQHFCLLIGYGAGGINPYLALESVRDLAERGELNGTKPDYAVYNFIKANEKGILKVMSKMGISTVQSYRGAQIFEAIGINDDLIERYFTRTPSRIQGIGLDIVEEETLQRHYSAFDDPFVPGMQELDMGGQYQWRRHGEFHQWNPEAIAKLQYATRSNDPRAYREFADDVNDQSRRMATLRGLLEFKDGQSIPIDEVEPAVEIVKRFATGAISLGSISREAHETMAIAMNQIGARSNTGEGGEDFHRYTLDDNGDNRSSAIKQVASGRFGVTPNYLVNATDLQIKMAQGSKPGEGGQLPGHKVDEYIGWVRHTTPGVELISPPPHHDIYSIEDLAQLIHDLKNINPDARIHVKLVSEVGVGTIAAGVSKGHGDVVLISGHDGGTGASPESSIKHAGLPWELGVAETQQVLVANDLRGRIVVQTDGQLKTGRDVAIAALLGAEEFGMATAALIVNGCIMLRKCHLNTCSVGIATQDPELRKRFAGQPGHLVNYFYFVAEELREIMAELGFRTVAEMVGRVDKLETRKAVDHWKASGIDLSKLLTIPPRAERVQTYCCIEQDHGLNKALDHQLIAQAQSSIDNGTPVEINLPVRNANRTVGAMLSGRVAQKYGEDGLPDDTIKINLQGSGGQSFGAFLAPGLSINLAGDTNDYMGKGIGGGRLVIVPPAGSGFVAEDNIIIGNVALYGATGGDVFIRGRAGERFAVRNSGARAVVEGVGDHGCEYMTGGVVAVIGSTGRNFGAGMSGGIAFVYDPDGDFHIRFNDGMADLEDLVETRGHRPAPQPPVRTPGAYRKRTGPANPGRLERQHEQVPQGHAPRLSPRAARTRPTTGGRTGNGLTMGKVTGFMEFGRFGPDRRPPAERVGDYREYYLRWSDEQATEQGGRCMDCAVPFCHMGCPLGNVIPDFNHQVYLGNWERALEVLLSTNNFPEFTGRICPAPCEASCVLSINADPVTIEYIEKEISDRGFEQGWIKPEPPATRSGKTVAVVGSGPSGLAAAQQLNRAGHTVTVFERADYIGGLLMLGIPDFKLEKSVVNRRVEIMAGEGIEFRTGVNIGINYPVEQLLREYDAVCLTGGSTQARDLDVPGRELDGVHFAMEYLPQQNRTLAGETIENQITAEGKRVIILGGGDTGADCLGTAHRQGAEIVHQFELLPEPPETRPDDNPWPTWPMILRTSGAHEEGGVRDYNILTKALTRGKRPNQQAPRGPGRLDQGRRRPVPDVRGARQRVLG